MLQVASLAIAYCMPIACPVLYQVCTGVFFQRTIACELEKASPTHAEVHFRGNWKICRVVSQRVWYCT